MEMLRKLIIICVITVLVILLVYPLFAYNYLQTNEAGQPIRWDNSKSIQYYLDPEPLVGYTLEQTHMMLQEAMKLWEDVATAKVPRFEFAGYLPEDVNESNYSNYLDKFYCYTESLEYCDNRAVHEGLRTVIIIDGNHKILENYLCLLDPNCIATAGPVTFEGGILDPDIQYIVQGYAVFGLPSITNGTTSYVSTMTHELGHLLGLGHVLINQQLFYAGTGITEPLLYLPTMLMNPGPGISAVGASYGTTLNYDDIVSVSYIYPSDTFNQETATIMGTVKKSDRSAMPKVNVIVRNVQDPLCKAYSFMTGRFCTHPGGGMGWVCLEGPDGSYIISGLDPADYTVEVEEVEDEDMAMAVGLYYDYQLAGDAEFWNEGDQASEDPYAYTVISLAAGETRENVDIILNRSEVTEGRVKYIPLDVILANFPLPATTACTDTTTDYAGLIGVDEGGDDATATTGGCSLIIKK